MRWEQRTTLVRGGAAVLWMQMVGKRQWTLMPITEWQRGCAEAFKPPNILSQESTLINLHFPDEEGEVPSAAECSQGHQADAGTRVQAQAHPTPEPVTSAAKTARVLGTSSSLDSLNIKISRKKSMKQSEIIANNNSNSNQWSWVLCPLLFLCPCVIPVLAGTEHLTGFQVYCVSLCICVHRSDRASSFQATKYVFGQLLSRSNRRANSKNMFL